LNLKTILLINAFLFIAGGIAFALYGPLMIDMYGILDAGGETMLYWYSASFSRMYGATLFGFGFLIWAASSLPEILQKGSSSRRSVILAMILANGMGLFVSITQQVSIWGNLTGWITTGYMHIIVGIPFIIRPLSKSDYQVAHPSQLPEIR
jgi:hypothetical protein